MKKVKNCFCPAVCLFFVILIILCIPAGARAVEPKISDILITNNNENVLLYARLVDGFKPDMESAILTGVPTVFTLHLEVYQERSSVWDKKISSHSVSRTIKYDNLKKTFSIFTNGDKEPVVLPDFESAQKAMVDFNGVAVMPLKQLVKGNSYYILIKIKINKVRLPLKMEYIFFFVSFWDLETAWYRQNFIY